MRIKLSVGILFLLGCLTTHAQNQTNEAEDHEAERDRRPEMAPDVRDDDSQLTTQKGDFVALPVPFSNPTFDTGLIAAGAYFYPQTEAEKDAQPASVTAVAAMYSSNDSLAYGIGHQH